MDLKKAAAISDTVTKSYLLTLKQTEPEKYVEKMQSYKDEVIIPKVQEEMKKYDKDKINILIQYEELNLEILQTRIKEMKRIMEEK